MLRFAMISKWHVHAHGYAQFVQQQGDARIRCVWDEDAARGRAWAEELGVDFEPDYDRLLARADVDAVLVDTPTNLHKRVMIKAARAKKHIFTEKVMALSVADCDEIIGAVKENGVTFTISFPHRCQPQDLFVKQAVEQGLLGDVTVLRIRNCHNGALANWLPEYWYDPVTTGGGAMMDLGAHGMYLANWLLGEPRRIQSSFNNITPRAVEDNAVCVIEFEGGAMAITETSLVSPHTPVLLEAYGTKGAILCSDDQVRMKTDETSALVEGGWITPKLPGALPHPIRQFIDSALYGEPVRFGLAEARALTRLMESAYGAHALRREVGFDSQATAWNRGI